MLRSFESLVGLGRLRGQINRAIVSCRHRRAPLGHCLLTGLGGTGKTTISRCIAKELGYHFVSIEGAEFKGRDSVVQCLVLCKEQACRLGCPFLLFIDETHRLSDICQEALYYPMTDGVLKNGGKDIGLGAWTLIGATTRQDMLEGGSFVTRFKHVWDIGRYSLYDMELIVAKEMMRHGIRLWFDEQTEIAKRCLGIPRVAVNLCEKIRDEVLFSHSDDLEVRREDVVSVFDSEGLDESGLGRGHLEYLQLLLDAGGKPKGLKVLAAQMSRNSAVVEDTIEPVLMSLHLISATSKGRVLTEAGYKHLANNAMI